MHIIHGGGLFQGEGGKQDSKELREVRLCAATALLLSGSSDACELHHSLSYTGRGSWCFRVFTQSVRDQGCALLQRTGAGRHRQSALAAGGWFSRHQQCVLEHDESQS